MAVAPAAAARISPVPPAVPPFAPPPSTPTPDSPVSRAHCSAAFAMASALTVPQISRSTKAWLHGRALLSLVDVLLLCAAASTCVTKTSAVSRWCCAAVAIAQARLCSSNLSVWTLQVRTCQCGLSKFEPVSVDSPKVTVSCRLGAYRLYWAVRLHSAS